MYNQLAEQTHQREIEVRKVKESGTQIKDNPEIAQLLVTHSTFLSGISQQALYVD